MLPAHQRLRRSADFTTTFRSGLRAGRRTLVVHANRIAPDPIGSLAPDTDAKVGFVVSKAVGGAVVRNRVKRRLRHLVAGLLRSIPPPPGSRFVVRALPAAATADHTELAADLTSAWQRVTDQLPRTDVESAERPGEPEASCVGS